MKFYNVEEKCQTTLVKRHNTSYALWFFLCETYVKKKLDKNLDSTHSCVKIFLKRKDWVKVGCCIREK